MPSPFILLGTDYERHFSSVILLLKLTSSSPWPTGMDSAADTGPCSERFSCLYKGRRQCLKENGSACLAHDRPGYANALLIPSVISADGLYKQQTKKQAIAAFQTAIDAHQGDKDLNHPEFRG